MYLNGVESEYLTAVYNEISKTCFGGKKFTDDDANKAEADIDFHITDDRGNGTWQHYFCQCMHFISLQCVDKFYFSWINGRKTGIQI